MKLPEIMEEKETSYQPIDCNFYDKLEAWATLKKKCQVQYRSPSGESKEGSGRIMDLYSVDKIEYLRLESGLEIRLDQIIQVNGEVLPSQC